MSCMTCTIDVLYIYAASFFGIDCLAYHTAIQFALYQPLYPEFIVIVSNSIHVSVVSIFTTAQHNYVLR